MKYKNNFILILFSFLSFIKLNAQILVVDSNTSEPIPFVEVYAENGMYLGNANNMGIMPPLLSEKIKSYSGLVNVILQHLSYEKLSIDKNSFLGKTKILLKPKIILLEELVVKPPNKQKALVISGYYRSYQLKGGRLEYFSDGKVELLYENPEGQGLNKRLHERVWYNKDMPPEGNFTIGMVGPAVPSFKILLNKNAKAQNLYKQASKDSNFVVFEHRKNDILNPKEIKFLGNESIIHFYTETYVFSIPYGDVIDPALLKYFKVAKSLKFKCKKCADFQDYSMQTEFFISDIKYLDQKSKDFKKFTGESKQSHFEPNFWQESESHPFFQPLDKHIINAVEKNLTMYPIK